jgi:YVTN family beta-propeller protein
MKKNFMTAVSIFFATILVLESAIDVNASIKMTGGINMWTSTPGALEYDSGKGEIFVALNNLNAVSIISDKTNTQIVNVTVGKYPFDLVYDSGTGMIFVSNHNSDTVSVISDETNQVVETIKVGKSPSGIAYDPVLGEIFVANFDSNTVSVINDKTFKVVANVTVGNYPMGVAYDSGKNLVFVANSNTNRGVAGSSTDNTVTVIDASNNKVLGTIPVGATPSGVAYDSVKGEVYVTNINDGTVSVIDDTSRQVSTSVKVSGLSSAIAYDKGLGAVFVISGTSLVAISDESHAQIGTVFFDAYSSDLAYNSGKGQIYVSHTAGNQARPATISIISDGASAAQSTGSLVATVKDSNGVKISGVTVSSTSQPAGQSVLSGVSGADGTVSFSGVATGSYTLQASKSGYVAATGSGSVAAGSAGSISITLQAQQTSGGGGGVPGFPLEATILGVILVLTLMLVRKRIPEKMII